MDIIGQKDPKTQVQTSGYAPVQDVSYAHALGMVYSIQSNDWRTSMSGLKDVCALRRIDYEMLSQNKEGKLMVNLAPANKLQQYKATSDSIDRPKLCCSVKGATV